MKGIVLTTEEKDELFVLINSFYTSSAHGSFEAFKLAEKRNIVPMSINNDLHVLSATFLTDTGYVDLRAYILNTMELNVRVIEPSEIPTPEEI